MNPEDLYYIPRSGSLAEPSVDDLIRERRNSHHVFCNSSHVPIGGPGCICVVTYRSHLSRLERDSEEFEKTRMQNRQAQCDHRLADLTAVAAADLFDKVVCKKCGKIWTAPPRGSER